MVQSKQKEAKMTKYFVATKTKSTGRLRQWSVNARTMTNAKKKFSKRKFTVLNVSKNRR